MIVTRTNTELLTKIKQSAWQLIENDSANISAILDSQPGYVREYIERFTGKLDHTRQSNETFMQSLDVIYQSLE